MNGLRRIAIIGAGAAGMTAAYFALVGGAEVTLYEKNKQAGRKICITGKGRCNLTNLCEARDFLLNVVQGSKFLSSAIYRFPPRKTMDWFEELGVSLKVERGNRVFPQSERASDVRDVLLGALRKRPGFSLVQAVVTELSREADGHFCVVTSSERCVYDAVILATGGLSYPLTGSTGDGYVFAEKLGHRVTPRSASLVRLVCAEDCCGRVAGLSLKNVRLSLYRKGVKKPLYTELGEMLFTDDGISGPLTLSASAHLRGSESSHRVEIDFKPALDERKLDDRLLRDFGEQSNRQMKHALDRLLPSAMRPIFVELSGIPSETRVHQITREQRARLVCLLKHFPLTILRAGPIEEAVVTAGGISLCEVDPHTMESRVAENLYFAGEVLDVDAYTGGFNLQIAFSTGKLAGERAAGDRP